MLIRSRLFFSIVAFALSLAACGGSVTSSDSGGGGTTSVGGSTSAGGDTSAGGTTTSGPTTTTFIGTTTPSTPICSGGFSVQVDVLQPTGEKFSCADNPANDTVEVDGVVISVAGGAVLVDECMPNTGCDPTVWTFTTNANPLDLSIPAGTFVHASLSVTTDFVSGCESTLAIKNLPTWNGVANPTISRPLVWLSATAMSYSAAASPGGDIGIEAIEVPECVPMPPAGQSVYKYRFYDALDEGNEVTVELGVVSEIYVTRDGKPEVWYFGNGAAGCLGASCTEGPVFTHFFTQAPGN